LPSPVRERRQLSKASGGDHRSAHADCKRKSPRFTPAPPNVIHVTLGHGLSGLSQSLFIFHFLLGKTDVTAAKGILVVLVCGLGTLSRDLPRRSAHETFMTLSLERSTGDR
jgi:hypothetical protein